MTTERPPHLTATTTDRGFDHLPPIPCVWGMDSIQVGQISAYESSSATSAALWLKAEAFGVAGDDKADVTSHLRITDALRLADQLVRLAAEHYHHNREDTDCEPLVSGAAIVTEVVATMLVALGEDEPILVLPTPSGGPGDEDNGPVEMPLHPRQVRDAMTALARIAGCEISEQWRVTWGASVGDWVGYAVDSTPSAGRVVERRFVITTPAEEVATS